MGRPSGRPSGRPLFLVTSWGRRHDQLLDSAEKLSPSHVEQGAEPGMTPVNPTGVTLVACRWLLMGIKKSKRHGRITITTMGMEHP